MPLVQVEMTMNDAQAWVSIQRMVRGHAQLEDAASKVVKVTAEQRKEAGELERAMKRVFEETRTPAEKHAQQLEGLKKLYAANKIDAETYGRAVAQSMAGAAVDVEKATGAQAKLAEQMRETQRVQEELGREGQRVWEATRTPLERYEQEMHRLTGLYQHGKIDIETYYRAAETADRSYRASVGETAKATQRAFGAEAFASIASYATGMLSIGSAVGVVKQALESVVRIREEAARGIQENEQPYSELAQVSHRDPAVLAAEVAKADEIAAQQGISKAAAIHLVFKAAATPHGMEDVDFFGELAGQGQTTDPAALMESVSTIKLAAGEKKNLSRHDIMSKLVAAGENSFKTIEQIAPAVAAAVTGAEAAGISLDESMGAIAYTSMTSTPEQASTGQIALQKAYARLRSPSLLAPAETYSQEQYDADAAQIEQQKKGFHSGLRDGAKNDRVYRQDLYALEVQKAQIHKHKVRSPESKAEQAMQLKEIAEKETEALQRSESRQETSPAALRMEAKIRDDEKTLAAKKKIIGTDVETDDDGHILDADAKKVRRLAATAMQKTGPGLFNEVHTMQSLHLDSAQMARLLGRMEALRQQNILGGNEGGVTKTIAAIHAAPGEDAIGAVLKLPKTVDKIRIAQQHRIEKGKLKAQDEEEYGSEETLYQTVIAAKQKKSSAVGRFFGDLTPDWLEYRKGYIQSQYADGILDDSPETLANVEKYLGNSNIEVAGRHHHQVEKARGMDPVQVEAEARGMVGHGATDLGDALAKMAAAAEKLQAAAEAHEKAAANLHAAAEAQKPGSAAQGPLVRRGVDR